MNPLTIPIGMQAAANDANASTAGTSSRRSNATVNPKEAAAAAAAAATSRAWLPAGAVSMLEAFGFWALILVYMWRIEFHASLAINVVFLGFLGLIPFGSSLLHRERPRELGFRLDNFARSARDTAIVTAAGAVIIVA